MTKKIRIGKDIALKWAILTNGEPEPLQGRDLKLILTTPLRQKQEVEFSVNANVIETKIYGTTQKSLGRYSLTLWENYSSIGQSALDACDAFELVTTTCMEGGQDNSIDTETIELSGDIAVGIKGASAYEIAVANGFVGSEEEWLASLKGDKGDAFAYDDFTPEQITELQKPAADAAKLANDAANSANQAATQATQAATQANDAAQSANQAAGNANAAGQSISRLELTIEQAEQSRISAEQSRSSAETTRQQAEQSRVSAETARTKAETTREQQELSRQSAEELRVNEFNSLKQSSETATNNANQAAQSANDAIKRLPTTLTNISETNEVNI